MTQDQQQKKAAGRDPNREHMTLSELWQLWRDNLMSWRSFCDEHHDLFTLNIQAGFRRIGRWLSDLRSNARALAAANRDRRFPESEYGAAQLFLFFRGSLERRAAAIREGFSNRRKALTWMGGKRRHFFEKMHLHPVAFLCGAMAIAAAATVLSLYTLGAQVTYDGQDLGIVSSRRAAEKVVAELEDVTRATTGDGGYTVDTALLTAETGVFPRRELISDDEFEETLSDTLGVVDYAYVLYVDGEKVVATTRSGALEDLLEQLKLGYETADTVNAYFAEEVDIRQEYVESSYVMNLGYIAEILNETKEGEVTYTVTSGDSYYSIAEKYDLNVEALMKLNPGYDPKILRVGDVLTISNAVPYLTVVNVERQRYVQDVPYQVEYTDDASMYQGEYKVTSPGVYGKADMTANVTYINGEETEREVVASVTLSQPVTEQQLRRRGGQRHLCQRCGDGADDPLLCHPEGARDGAAAPGHEGAAHLVSHRVVLLALHRHPHQPVRLSKPAGQHLPQRHRHRQQLRHVHLRLRRRHGDVLRLDERVRLSDHHRPRQRVSDVLRA